MQTLEMEKTLNMGVGMVAVVPPESADAVLAILEDRGVESWLLGEIVSHQDGAYEGGAALYGDYAL